MCAASSPTRENGTSSPCATSGMNPGGRTRTTVIPPIPTPGTAPAPPVRDPSIPTCQRRGLSGGGGGGGGGGAGGVATGGSAGVPGGSIISARVTATVRPSSSQAAAWLSTVRSPSGFPAASVSFSTARQPTAPAPSGSTRPSTARSAVAGVTKTVRPSRASTARARSGAARQDSAPSSRTQESDDERGAATAVTGTRRAQASKNRRNIGSAGRNPGAATRGRPRGRHDGAAASPHDPPCQMVGYLNICSVCPSTPSSSSAPPSPNRPAPARCPERSWWRCSSRRRWRRGCGPTWSTGRAARRSPWSPAWASRPRMNGVTVVSRMSWRGASPGRRACSRSSTGRVVP